MGPGSAGTERNLPCAMHAEVTPASRHARKRRHLNFPQRWKPSPTVLKVEEEQQSGCAEGGFISFSVIVVNISLTSWGMGLTIWLRVVWKCIYSSSYILTHPKKKTRSHCNCLKNYWKHTDATRYGHLPSVDESIHLFKSNPEPFHLDAIKLTDIEHECW